MSLQTYWAKRDFRKTPEPRGKRGKAKTRGLSFVVQKHAASRLHYDFRLELDGVLLSWAIPKGPSFDPADKRLAMQTEDHPLEYGGFEGVIPKGEYGGGTVMLWDRGTWAPKGDAKADLERGNLKFTLDGDKLKGGWVLVRTHGSKYGKSDGRSWLLIKERDEFAKRGGEPIVDAAPDSVTTGRTLDDIAHAAEHVWHSNKSVAENVKAGAVASKGAGKKAAVSRAPVAGARKAALPDYVAPMLTTLMAEPPEGDDWIHEIKYDGYRLVARIERGKARLYSRNGKEWTAEFPQVAKDLAQLPVQAAWVDGEVAVLDESGRTSFQALQNVLSSASQRGLAFFAFDLMYLDGYDLRGVVLTERKRALRDLVGKGVGVVRVGPEIQGHGGEFFAQACKLALEGTIAKRASSTYAGGMRTREWQKIKCIQRQEMVIGGYTDPQGSRKGFGALLLGYHDDGELRYAGKVGTGFDDRMLRELAPQLAKREQKVPPFANPPRGYEAKGAHWVKPDLVAEIAFTEWSRDGALRHPSFQGLRPDKKASEVVRERPQEDTKPASKRAAKRSVKARGDDPPAEFAGIAISSPDKLYFPEAGITKADVAAYLVDIAPRMLPHITGRPLSLVRCPDGWKGQCFYQKHADKAVNAAVSRVQVRESKGMATYLSASTPAALIGLLQWGVVELHPWGSRKPRLDRPDRLIFDFDPDADLPWSELVTGVMLLRTLLDEMKLTGFLKTTGGKGLHVVVPIRATLTWEEAKSFSRGVAEFLVRTFPGRFITTVSKAQRKDKIFIDYLRNSEGATAIAPYAIRARANAPVSTPIEWSELAHDVRNDHFNLRNVRERLASLGRDPWSAFFDVKQSVTAAMRKRIES